MFLSNPAKIFHALCCLSMLFAGCTLWRGNENSAVTFASQPKSEYPFAAREPEVFHAELVVQTGETERRMFIARSGEKRRIDYDVGTESQHGVIIADKEYLLFFKRKVFEERSMSSNAADSYDPLSAQMLGTRDYASFDEVGRSGPVVQFNARINGSSNSETIIFFDEAIGLPVKQEFYSIEGEERKLLYSCQLRNFSTTVDPATFEVPAGFKKVIRAVK
jgi:outer membrane lipoprotein-sorting protein